MTNYSMFLTILYLCCFTNYLIQGRVLSIRAYNYSQSSQISAPPMEGPSPNSPNYNYAQSSPAPSPVSDDHDDKVLNVLTFGAVGDGSTDDTSAFKTAWDAACAVDNGKIFAPSGYSFLLQPLIFSGPCKSGVLFQVYIATILITHHLILFYSYKLYIIYIDSQFPINQLYICK